MSKYLNEFGACIELNIKSNNEDNLRKALAIFVHPEDKYVYFFKRHDVLIISETKYSSWLSSSLNISEDDIQNLGYSVNVDGLVNLITYWLKTQSKFDNEPDIDGSCKKGFEMEYRWLNMWDYGIVVKPYWVEISK